MKLARIGIIASSGGAVQAAVSLIDTYMTLSGTSEAEGDHLKTFVETGIEEEWYWDLVALWPFTGSSLANKVYSIIDPEDSNEANRLTITGVQVLDHAKGIEITSGGVSHYLRTYVYPHQIGGTPHAGGSVYLQNISNYFQYTGPGTTWHLNHYDQASSAAHPRIGRFTTAGGAVAGGNQVGHWMQQRPDNTKSETFHNAVLKNSLSEAFDTMDPTQNIILVLGIASVMSYQAIYRAMSAPRQAQFHAAIQTLMTGLNRNV